MKIKNILLIVFVLLMLPASPASAHKVIIFAWVEDGMIHTESSFGSKRKAKDSIITVMDEKGLMVHQGKTDQDGKYSFKIPDHIQSDLILNLTAGTGHQAQWKLSRDELKIPPSQKDIQAAMKEKETLEESPSVFKIIGGIAIIFLLALAVKFSKRKPNLK
ncbi:MAG: hypothetical protein KKE44_24480 [Proteobacteria bacterium]|nr:hypothetical protein [Pseudomonadota bacterium]MBU1585890.1 hypothetical protein [Pseudomonadota bacterium]MBU2453727.1 hypothetical protein [Pseudomonadota bacterium]MBU2627953.1 hypothetical protein [Pseudomonadota bacterium]